MGKARPPMLLLLLAGALALAAGVAAAQDGDFEASADDLVLDDGGHGERDYVAEAFARMDSDRDGVLTLEEFETGSARPRGMDGVGVVYQRLPARFRALDADASGYLEAGEFEALVQRWQGPGPAPSLQAADRNGDARLDFREFARMLAPPDDAPPDHEADGAALGAEQERPQGRRHRARQFHVQVMAAG